MALATDISDLARTSFTAQFNSGLLAGGEDFFRFGKLWTDKSEIKEIQSLAAGGAWTTIASTTAVDGVTPEEVVSGKATFTRVDMALKTQLTLVDWRKLLNTLEANGQAEVAAQLGKAAAQKLNLVGFTGLLAMSTTAHPMTGAALKNVGTKNWLDTGLVYRQTKGDAGTQDTLLSMSLSLQAYTLARKALRSQRTVQGLRLNTGSGQTALVCGLDDENEAKVIVGSPMLGIDNRINPELGNSVVIATPEITNGEWYLIDVGAEPIGVWTPEPIDLQFVQLNTTHVEVGVNISAKFVGRPYAEGIVASEP